MYMHGWVVSPALWILDQVQYDGLGVSMTAAACRIPSGLRVKPAMAGWIRQTAQQEKRRTPAIDQPENIIQTDQLRVFVLFSSNLSAMQC